MAPVTRAAEASWAAREVASLPEFWALVAEHSGLVGAWRLMRVCKPAREGAKKWLRTLPGLVVCGGYTGHGGEGEEDEQGHSTASKAWWRLDLGELQWEHLCDFARGRCSHACCAVRGAVVVLGGEMGEVDDSYSPTATVEIMQFREGSEEEAEGYGFEALPPLSCGPFSRAVAVSIDESESEKVGLYKLNAVAP
jgi:hypothetical protein